MSAYIVDDATINKVVTFFTIKASSRDDGKICTAQPGECRFNRKYYTSGMRDAKSWSDPSADGTCPGRCPYLSDTPRDMGDEPTRRARANTVVFEIARGAAGKEAHAALLLGAMGLDPRDYLDRDEGTHE